MLRNYFKTAWRIMSRHKTYTLINVLGLALGICTCIIIYLITTYEFSFDAFHPDRDRVYRIVGELKQNTGEINYWSKVPSPAPAGLRSEIPGMQKLSSFYPYWTKIDISDAGHKPKTFDCIIEGTNASSVIIADPNYFQVFHYDWVAGNAASALDKPFTVVLSESKALKYFGSLSMIDMIGKEVVYNDSLRIKVSGIVKDWNKNTDFPFTDFISFNTIDHSFLKKDYNTNDWNGRSLYAFVKLPQGISATRVNSQFEAFIKKNVKVNAVSKLSMKLEPLSDIHFNANYDIEDIRKAHLPTLYGLMTTAIFILVIAIINFINLSTAQSIQRTKEIGVRKILGSSKANLILQFLTETLIITFLALLIALLIIRPVLFVFHDFITSGVSFDFLNPATLVFILSVTFITSFLAGLYPAKVLSSSSPVLSLKENGNEKGRNKWWLRKGLIVFQFTISLIFIVATIVISDQVRYIRNKDLGLNADQIITVEAPSQDSSSNAKILAQQMKQLPAVEGTAMEILPPIGAPSFLMHLKYQVKNQEEMTVLTRGGNEDFIPLYKIRLLAGRNLLQADSMKELVINECYAKALGFSNPEEALGKFLYAGQMNFPPIANNAYPIVGVVADFHEYSFHEPIKPTVIAHIPQVENRLAIKLSSLSKQNADTKFVLSQIEKKWKEVYPNGSFSYNFLNDSIAKMYEKEQRTSTLIYTSMIVTIFISCIGLLGLIMFTAEKRTKEIGIRKVLGATVMDIFKMLSKDFVVLIVLALLIASPVAWFLMDKWLQDFVYRIQITWWMFLEGGIAAVVIALIIVSFHTIKTAISNPVKSLRTE